MSPTSIGPLKQISSNMFDGSLPEIPDLAALEDAALIDAARGWARAENAACARKQAVMAELFARRTGLDAGEREQAAVTAELAAAQIISRGLALHQTHRGVALRDQLPKVAALFEAGLISDLLVRTIVWRTYLIADSAAMATVDTELAAQVTAWGVLSIAKTEQAIDALVDAHDPGRCGAAAPPAAVAGCSSAPPPMRPASPPCGRGCMPPTAPRSSSASRTWRAVCASRTRAPWPSGAPTPWAP